MNQKRIVCQFVDPLIRTVCPCTVSYLEMGNEFCLEGGKLIPPLD